MLVFFLWFGHYSLASSSPSFPNSEKPVVFYANQNGNDLQLLFVQALAQAKNSIYIEMYAITDPILIQLLRTKADQGVDVNILADHHASPALRKKLGVSSSTTPRLVLHKGRGLMHRKIVVIDHRLTLIGSANFTPASLMLHDNFVLAMENEKIAHFFEYETCENQYFCLNGQSIDAWKLPKNGKAAKNTILDELAKAQHSIHVAMFTMTDPILSQALIRAHQRGVRVYIALDYYTAAGSSKKIAQELSLAGIPIRTSMGAQLFHHKWALIDKTTLITGSTNWTKSAFTHNRDDFVIVRNLTEEQQKLMLRLWRLIENSTR